MDYIYIGLGGILGAVSRYGLGQLVCRRWQRPFPLATFLINITGSFALGLMFGLWGKAGGDLPGLYSFAATGFLGAYTTYSTFSYEIVALVRQGSKVTAVKYFAASVAFGVAAALAGTALGGLS